jgi:hypothetical protein
MTAKHALMIGIFMAAASLTGCSTGPSDEDLKSEAECLVAIGVSDVQIVDREVLYTMDPARADLPGNKAALAACKPGATPESVHSAVTGTWPPSP